MQAQQVVELAEQEECLRARLAAKEAALAAENPPMFKHAQVGGWGQDLGQERG